MAEAWGQILQFLGSVLNGIYQAIPSYGLAIIILTVVVRVVLYPLAVKQIRSMTAMQKIQPRLKEIQKKHKGDRQKLNEETMKLYKEHGVNPLGGCFPMLLQMPVFIALYAVIRAGVPFTAVVVNPSAQVQTTKATVCRPAGTPKVGGESFTQIVCETNGQQQVFDITKVEAGGGSSATYQTLPSWVTNCKAPSYRKTDTGQQELVFSCQSPVGTGHLPKTGKLFSSMVQDKGTFLGMHLACSPTQATSNQSIRQCTAAAKGGGVPLAAYFGLVALMALTTWYQQKQMLGKAPPGPQTQQMQMMARIMPVFMGFLSLSFPSALSLYWVVGNIWMIGQQHVLLRGQEPAGGAAPPQAGKGKPKPALPSGKGPGKKGPGKPGKR